MNRKHPLPHPPNIVNSIVAHTVFTLALLCKYVEQAPRITCTRLVEYTHPHAWVSQTLKRKDRREGGETDSEKTRRGR